MRMGSLGVGANAADDLEAVDIGQTEIEDEQVGAEC